MNGLKKTACAWGIGLLMFVLRLIQNLKDFDSETGLHTLSAAGIALYALIAVSGVAMFILSRQESGEKRTFASQFSAPDRLMIPMVVGSFLMAAGGALTLIAAYHTRDVITGGLLGGLRAADITVTVLAIASCIGFIALTGKMRHDEADSVVPVLPAMFFGAFWVLSLYLPAAEDPVFARYYLPILAAAMTAYAFAELGGFFRGESKVRNFRFVAGFAVALCMAAVAELNAGSLLFAGCGVILSVLLLLSREQHA